MSYRPFAEVEPAPPDPILGLTEDFRNDANPRKINLTSGVFLNEAGVNPVLNSVKQAEKMWLEQETTKDYLGIAGEATYAQIMQQMIFGPYHPAVREGRIATVNTPGGTAALRVGADFLRAQFPTATIRLSDPTWPNHPGVFRSAGFAVESYPYYAPESHSLKVQEMLAALERVPEGDVVLLHACCHNPTGVDPDPEQWQRIVEVFQQRPIIPFLDFAYQGFGTGSEEDAYAVRAFADAGLNLVVASSYSKNFGLYRERVGALSVVTTNAGETANVMSRLKQTVRGNYSNPPAHGSKIVEIVFGTPELRRLWEHEVVEMRDRIREMRRSFVQTLKKHGLKRDFSFLLRQKGMFSYSGIGKEAVRALREDYSIYIVENGRINVAAMTGANMEYLCRCIAAVLKE